MKFPRHLIAAILAAALALWQGQAWAAATLLPNGEQCFSALAATSGGTFGPLSTLGSITGGSGYVNNTYTNVPLTGGSGFGATATITVSGGTVTGVSLTNLGAHYAGGDVLSAATTSIGGGAGSGFSVPVNTVTTTGTGMVGLLGPITGGSGGVAGLYPGVALTGGSGTGATANITVSGGAVTAVVILNPGSQYQVSDTLSAASGTIGGVTGFSVPISSVTINQSLAGGSVSMYQPGTLTFKQTWFNSDQAATHQNTNPITLDANGCAIIYGTGIYRQVLKDALGNTVWDQTTTDTSATNNVFWAGVAGGTPNVITVVDPGFNATDGSIINFTANATNTSAVTLNPSNFGAISIVKDTTAGPVSLIGGEIVQNNAISVVYRIVDNAFHILNPVTLSASGSTAPLCGATGYKVQNNGVSPNTQLLITADNVVTISATGAVVNRSNVSVVLNFAINGIQGLDTGTLQATTVYHVWLVDNGAQTLALGSLSATSPILPAGFTFKCRLSAVPTNASAQLFSIQTLGSETYTSTTIFSSAISGTCFSSFVPLTFVQIPSTAIIAIGKIGGVGAQNVGVGITSTGPTIVSYTGVASLSEGLFFRAPLINPQLVNFCSDSALNSITIVGWVDKVNVH